MTSTQKTRTEGLTYAYRPHIEVMESKVRLVTTETHSQLIYMLNSEELPLSEVQSLYGIEMNFSFSNEFVKKYDPDFEAIVTSEHPQEICCQSRMHLFDILQCSAHSAISPMFITGKAMLLWVCFHQNRISKETPCSTCKFLNRATEKEKIIRAREILLSCLEQPPTIPELAQQIEINQCYLKKGFKEIFGSTVYEFVQEQRMHKAKMLLSNSNYSIAQVADKIGYASPGHFSAAFKKYAGIFPSEVQQN